MCKYLIASSGVDSYITNPQGQQLFASPSPPPWSLYITNRWITEQGVLVLCPKVTSSECRNPLNLSVSCVIFWHSWIPSARQEGAWLWRALIAAGNLEMLVWTLGESERKAEIVEFPVISAPLPELWLWGDSEAAPPALPSWEVIQHLLMPRHTAQGLGQEWWWQWLLGLTVCQKTQHNEESVEINAAVPVTALKALLRRGIYGVYCIIFWLLVLFSHS